MSTRTSDDLVTETLRFLVIIGANETASVEDAAYVKARYYDKHAELCAPPDHIAYWDRDTVPSEIFLTMRDLLANEVKATFGKPQSPQDKEADDVIIMRRLRRQAARKAGGAAIQADYF